MSKIYEALRQAELDRAKNGSVQSDSDSSSSPNGQTLLDKEHEPIFLSPKMSAVATSSPVKLGAERVVAELPATKGVLIDMQPEPIDAAAALMPQFRSVIWNPSLAQLPALEERGSAVEQFRSLRSRMQEFRDLNTLKTILVSSGLPQEGKSFVTANLAISFARHKGGRVLLIDGDMRRATAHKMLGAPQGPGLTEYLSGDASIADVLQRPIVDDPKHPIPAGLASLSFIPAGNEHDKAADLSGNHRFNELLEALSPHFDWIVVDSSPVNLVSDGVNLARACDAVLLVARGGVTKYQVTQRAIAELKASKVLGIVLNAVKNPPAAGGYYGYDGYDKIKE
jgi:protein-tyrosine kinase